MPKKNNGLGRGLDSLIPSDFYDEDFDSNSSESLEDVLNDKEEKTVETKVEKPIKEDINKEAKEDKKPEVISEDTEVDTKVNQDESDDLDDDLVQEHVNEVLEIVKKNPRITLWSVRSSAVFRYLRKTKPEFSISKEASSLIDEAVSKKYPDIWELFKDI
ncbi:MAG: AAA family ATPase [Methanobrevibacter wolinii]|nr:AAA family ATPase [Methanobrevibacter wolinii]